MSIFIPRKKEFWSRRPVGEQEINWGHWASDGLVYYSLLNSTGTPTDIAGGFDSSLRTNADPDFDGLLVNNTDDPSNSGAEIVGSNSGDLDFTSDFTIVAEVTKTLASLGDDYRTIFGKRNDSGYQYQFRVTNDNKLNLLTTGSSIASSYTLAVDERAAVAVSSDSSGRIFNKNSSTETGIFRSISHVGAPAVIGSNSVSGASNQAFGGVIHRLSAYSKKLEAEELIELAEAPYQLLKARKTYFPLFVSGSQTNVDADRALVFDSILTLAPNKPTPIDNLSQINAESTAFIEYLSRSQSNRALMAEYSSAINADGDTPIDWPGHILMDRHAPFDLINEHHSDRLLPTEHLSSLRVNKTLPIDYLSLISSTHFLPTEWIGQAVFVADRLLPVSWDQLIATDRSTPLDTSTQMNLSRALPVSFLSSALADRSAPISHLFSVDADRAAPLEWSGQLVVNADAIFPIEWRGGVLLNADKTLPLNWLNELESDQSAGFGSLLTIVTDQIIPTSFNAGLVADQAAGISWLESLGINKAMLFEHRGAVVVNADQTIPIEWVGVSGFIAGNLHVFNIDDRGHIWHVPARGQTWRVPPRRK
ncbi:MAG: LamG domain-containing protein [Proteobacteria bacterium]|nr:LamG domain-containing protein [Pseudomonadota bacterium]